MASSSPPPADPERLFEDDSLALCVLDSLIAEDLVSTDLVIPALAPTEDDDPDDESESWRDRVDEGQLRVTSELLALLAANRDALPKLTVLESMVMTIAEDYEPDVRSLAGLEQCTALESVALASTYRKLDLRPLTKLPALTEVHLLGCDRLKDLEPLFEIPTLTRVTGDLPEPVARELLRRGVALE